MTANPRVREEFKEDTSGLAGWIFADLILGLMVVFLATISFIPVIESFQGPSALGGAQTSSVARLYPQPFEKTYPSPSATQIDRDLLEFIEINSLPADSSISFLEISGSYDPLTQDSSVGVLKALKVNEELQESSSLFSQGVSVKFVGWPSGDTAETRIKLYLIFNQEVRVD
jgi:hypothetical protein